jgi:signal peptidase I
MLVGALAAAIYGFGNFFQPTVVVGESMSPTLKNGRVIWIDRTYYKTHKPQCGEVVVFKDDAGITYVKRVYRGPGESLHYIASGSSFLLPVREPFAESLKARYEEGRGLLRIREMRVDDDCVFVLGDNFNVSIDSRQIGPVPIRSIIGRAHLDATPSRALRYEFVPKTLGRPRMDLARVHPVAPARRIPSTPARLVSNDTAPEVAPLVVDGSPEFRTNTVRYTQR